MRRKISPKNPLEKACLKKLQEKRILRCVSLEAFAGVFNIKIYMNVSLYLFFIFHGAGLCLCTFHRT
jgi:hypothetical protein